MTTEILKDYPPANHMLRDLRIAFAFEGKERVSVQAPVVPEICTNGGSVGIGVMATLVDVLGGILSSRVLHPDWMATASLSIHTHGRVSSGHVVGLGHVIRTGRTMVVIHVDIHSREGGSERLSAPIGSALMTFSRLRTHGKTTGTEIRIAVSQGFNFGLEGSGFKRDFLDTAGVCVKRAHEGIVAIEMHPYVRNSIGSLQGGMIATLADVAGQQAAESQAGKPVRTSDLVIHYLSPGRVGPFETRTHVLRLGQEHVLSRVEVVDSGARDRLMAVVMNTGMAAGE